MYLQSILVHWEWAFKTKFKSTIKVVKLKKLTMFITKEKLKLSKLNIFSRTKNVFKLSQTNLI